MEINVTKIINQKPLTQFSDSIANSGLQNISKITYNNAVEQKEFVFTPEQLQAWLDYVPEFGAWSIEEIESWSQAESTGLFVQFVSSAYQELEFLADHKK